MFKILISVSLLLTSTMASAQNFSCTGIPEEINVWKTTGAVSVRLKGHGKTWLICKLKQNNGCEGILSIAHSHMVTKSPIALQFHGHAYDSCANVPAYTAESITDFDYLRTIIEP